MYTLCNLRIRGDSIVAYLLKQRKVPNIPNKAPMMSPMKNPYNILLSPEEINCNYYERL